MPNRPHRRPTRGAGLPLPVDPITVAEARLAGWTPSAQRHAIDLGELVRARRGVVSSFLRPDPTARRWDVARDTHLRAARAAVVSSPRSVLSHAAAAIAVDLPVLQVPVLPCLTVQSGTPLRRVVAAHLHRATLGDDDVTEVDGVGATTPARTVMDVARELGVDAGVVAADAALYRGLVDPYSLGNAFDQCRGWPGRKRARITLLSVDGRAESPLESLSRLRMRDVGLPTPGTQVDIHDLDGRFLGRADFYWDEFGVVGEADGDLKYVEGDALVRERRRQQLFERAGLLVVRWGFRDLRAFPEVARQCREAFARGTAPGSPARRWTATPAALHLPPSLIRLDEPN